MSSETMREWVEDGVAKGIEVVERATVEVDMKAAEEVRL
jgi:hypothetical protein